MKNSTICSGLMYLLAVVAIGYIGLYVYLALSRMPYPFALEWQEGLTLEHVRRILSGKRLYVPPSLEFVPYNYPPVYFYVSAIVSRILGEGFIPLRLVSFLSSLGCFYLIFAFVKKETSNVLSGILAAGLFAATYKVSGAWFDLARIDSLFLVLLLLAFYCVRFYTATVSFLLVGVFISLAFFTKQTSLVIAIPIVLYCIVIAWRHSVILISTILVGILGGTFLLDSIHDGWYMYYTFGLLQNRQAIVTSMLVSFWSKDMAAPLGIALGLSLLYGVMGFEHSKKQVIFYGIMAGSMVGGSWVARFKAAGYVNNLMTAYAVIAIIFGIAFHSILEQLHQLPRPYRTNMTISVYGICLLQFLGCLYNPMKQIPTSQDLEAGQEFVAELERIPGNVFLLRHGYLLKRVGKQPVAQEMTIHDILTGDSGAIKKQFEHKIEKAIASTYFDAIIVDGPWMFSHRIEQYYTRQQRIFEDNTVFWPVTGHKTRPEFLYVPKGKRL